MIVSATFLLKFFKFSTVGLVGTLIDYSVIFITKELLKINKFVANALGFCVAAMSNYIWNRIWTFQSHNEVIYFEFLKFLSVALVGLLINHFVVYLFHEKLKFNFYYAKFFAIGIVVFWNFLGNYFFTFSVGAV